MTFLLVGLAAARLTRLWVDDAITENLRGWVLDHTHGKLEVLFGCPWCISLYATAAAGGVAWACRPFLVLLAGWQVAVTAYWATQALAKHAES